MTYGNKATDELDVGQADYVILVESLASGQPRAYADHQYVDRVTFLARHKWRTEPVWEADDWSDFPNGDERQIAKALAVLGYTDLPTLEQRRASEDWFGSWLDYARVVAPGVVEVRKVTPYID